MRTILALAALVALSTLAIGGCGTSFPLPTETRTGREYSSDESYQMVDTWYFTGTDSIADILLTQGPGSQLFLLFQSPGPGTSPRGSVQGYALKAKGPSPQPLGIVFRQVFNPHAVCATGSRVFVLDQGDTALARDPLTGRVSDLSLTWRVREYGLLGRDTLGTFTDTSMAFVQGVAVDNQGRAYVSGSAIVWIPDQLNPSIRTRTFQYRVNRYIRVTPGSVPPDPYMPGTDRWIRDLSYTVEEGSGLGTVVDPRGLYWLSGGPGGAWEPGLFVADFAKNWVQKLSDAGSSTGIYRIEADSTSLLSGPTDVAADLKGYVYLTDTGNQRVLRYDPLGTFLQRVDVEPDSRGQPLAEPVGVAADDSLVYVADRAANKVVRYLRRR